mmetsp:Transcript_8087/g.25381  ORF Transcript_8087/g.25381 Transcript_8087/m.25381 type:complete len:341 (-) Transcript_8087:97-1119(-)|eukprot:CAMPEP_0196782266 /NCGR_PEP_ID=MMETSP1104-20130614/11171_1 /TAXON_ID=33652 /ORGANISM="Cafeteria sp., Strain Caron Lab Isolate" /LENGTH=340 /DNA_ID=CAMNT_0042152497 /DNA_START=59 /DNA_END=1081 /DNA_ORIENTATION=+
MGSTYFELECRIVRAAGLLKCGEGDKVTCRVECENVRRDTAPAAINNADADFHEPTPFQFTVDNPHAASINFTLFRSGTTSEVGRLTLQAPEFHTPLEVPAATRPFPLDGRDGYLHLQIRLVERVAAAPTKPSRFGILHYLFIAANVLLVALSVTSLVEGAVSSASWATELSIGGFLPKAIIGVAITTVVLALFGFFAVFDRNTFYIRTYSYMTIILILVTLVIGALCIGTMEATSSQLDHGWDSYRGDQADRLKLRELENDLQCCGFYSVEDRAVEPCPGSPASPPPGCYNILEDTVDAQLRNMGSLGIVLSVIQLAAVVFGLLIARGEEATHSVKLAP